MTSPCGGVDGRQETTVSRRRASFSFFNLEAGKEETWRAAFALGSVDILCVLAYGRGSYSACTFSMPKRISAHADEWVSQHISF